MVWDTATGTKLHTLTRHADEDGLRAVALTPDGRSAVCTYCDGITKVWDLDSGAELQMFADRTGFETCIVATPDGREAVTSSRRGISVWDLETGTELRALVGRDRNVRDIAVTPDGRCVIAAAQTYRPFGTVKVWDQKSGALMCAFQAESEVSFRVASDGLTVIARDGQHRLHFLLLENITPGPPVAADTSDAAHEATLRRGLSACREAESAGGVVGYLAALIALLKRTGRAAETSELQQEHDALAAQLHHAPPSGERESSKERDPDPYKAAASAEATRRNLDYQSQLAAWRSLPWWRRLTRRRPVAPEGI